MTGVVLRGLAANAVVLRQTQQCGCALENALAFRFSFGLHEREWVAKLVPVVETARRT